MNVNALMIALVTLAALGLLTVIAFARHRGKGIMPEEESGEQTV